MSLGNRLRQLEKVSAERFGKRDWRAISQAVSDAENQAGVFRLPIDASAEAIGLAVTVAQMQASIGQRPGAPGPAVFVGDRQVWPEPGDTAQ